MRSENILYAIKLQMPEDITTATSVTSYNS